MLKYRYRVLAFLFVLSIITFIDRVSISVAGSRMQADLGLSPSQWGWILGSFALAYAIFEIPTGRLTDRIGPRRVMTRIVVWWSVFTSLTGVVRKFWPLFGVRFLFGAGEAGAFPNSAATVVRWFPSRERARAQGVVWMGSKVGGAVAPLVVIPIQQAFGWRVAFAVFGLLGLAWAGVWYAWFRDTPAEKPGVSAAERAEIGQISGEGAHRPMPWRLLLTQPNLWWLMLMYHTYCWLGFFYLSWMHTFLVKGRGYTPHDLIRFSWLPFVLGAVTNPLGGALSDALVKRIGLKWGRRSVGMAGLLLSGGFVLATVLTRDKMWSVVFLGLGLAGSDFMLPVAWAVCLDISDTYAGTVSAAMNTAGQVGSFLSSVAFGYIVTASGSYNTPLVVLGAMAVLSAFLWLKIDPTQRVDTGAA